MAHGVDFSAGVPAAYSVLGALLDCLHICAGGKSRRPGGANRFLTDAATMAPGLSQAGIAHREEYPDVGPIQGRILELGGVDEVVPT